MVGLPRPPFSHLDRPCWRLVSGGPDPLASLLPGGSASATAIKLRQRRMGTHTVGRFNPGVADVLYLGFAQATCRAECVHHWTRIILDTGAALAPGDSVTGRFRLYRVNGLFADIRAGFDAFQRPGLETYPHCQRLAMSLVAEGRVDGILYRSARLAGGTCVAAWAQDRCEWLRDSGTARLTWDGKTLH